MRSQAKETAHREIMSGMPSARRNVGISLWLLLVIATLALRMRIDDLGFVPESLWYEDGEVFLNQVHKFGLKTLLLPESGYLFTYQRLVALLAGQAPLVAAPYIFFFAWCASFYSIVWVLRVRASIVANNGFLISFLVIAIALQPSHGEPFFNLVHAHFFLGIALSLYICMPSRDPPKVTELIFLALSSTSGPFSALMLPVLAVQVVVFRDFIKRAAIYLIVIVGGLIQLALVLTSGRVSDGFDFLGLSWTGVASSFLLFGEAGNLIIVAAIVFWSITLSYAIRLVAARRGDCDANSKLPVVFALASAAIVFLVSVLTVGRYIPSLSPMDMGSRYFLVPYSLVFFAAILGTKDSKIAQAAVLCMISTICAARFVTVDRAGRESSTGLLSHTNMQWTAFAKFQRVKPDLRIPINAALPLYPPIPSVQVPNTAVPESPSRPIALSVTSPAKSGLLYFQIGKYCERANYIAMEIDVWRSRMGWAEVSWGRVGGLGSNQSLSRFYPGGDAIMQFAFYRDLSDDLLKLDLAQGVAESPVVRTLSKWTAPGLVVAEPTAAGGPITIKGIRLFCLE